MKKRLLPLLLCVCMILSVLGVVAMATDTSTSYEATIMEAYGGARGIVSMTFDDGDWNTNVWLDQMFDKYDLYGSTMAIVRGNYESQQTDINGTVSYVADANKIAKWKELFANGRLEPESHTYTHIPLPSDSWATGDNAHHLDALCVSILEDFNCLYSCTACSKHNICNDYITFSNVKRQLAVILYCFLCVRVTEHTNVSDFCSRNKLYSAVNHTKTCTENWNERKLSA